MLCPLAVYFAPIPLYASFKPHECPCYRHRSSFRGYQRVQENITNGRGDYHEALDFYSESEQARMSGTASGPSNYGQNQWPSQDSFQLHYEEYITQMRRCEPRH